MVGVINNVLILMSLQDLNVYAKVITTVKHVTKKVCIML